MGDTTQVFRWVDPEPEWDEEVDGERPSVTVVRWDRGYVLDLSGMGCSARQNLSRADARQLVEALTADLDSDE